MFLWIAPNDNYQLQKVSLRFLSVVYMCVFKVAKWESQSNPLMYNNMVCVSGILNGNRVTG
jgi:hypothetical protein